MNNVQLQEAINKTREFILDAQPIANSGPKYEAWSHAVKTLQSLETAQSQRALMLKARNQS